MCVKSINTVNIFDFVPDPDQYKTQEMCDKVVSQDPFMLKYCPGKYKTKKCIRSCSCFSTSIRMCF